MNSNNFKTEHSADLPPPQTRPSFSIPRTNFSISSIFVSSSHGWKACQEILFYSTQSFTQKYDAKTVKINDENCTATSQAYGTLLSSLVVTLSILQSFTNILFHYLTKPGFLTSFTSLSFFLLFRMHGWLAKGSCFRLFGGISAQPLPYYEDTFFKCHAVSCLQRRRYHLTTSISKIALWTKLYETRDRCWVRELQETRWNKRSLQKKIW